MLITCPACDARYEADDALFPETGRTVRCSACEAEWTVWPQTLGASAAAGAVREPEVAPELSATRFAPLEAPEPQFARSLEDDAEPEAEGGRGGGFLWGFVAAAAVALGATLLYARHADVAAAVPQLAGTLDVYVATVDALRARLAEVVAGLGSG